MPVGIKKYRLTEHALFEMKRRGIIKEDIEKVLANPEQVVKVREERVVFQSRVERGKSSRIYLLRIFVDMDRRPAEVVTAYYTTKTDKYWSKNHEGDL